MAVKIRLARRGRKKLAIYDIVVADARAPRDGCFIEKLGNYNPNTDPSTILLKEEKILQWLLNGAQPTNTVRNILSSTGILLKKHLQVGVKKEAITQEKADTSWEAWKQAKKSKIAKRAEKINQENKTKSTSKKPVATKETTPKSDSQPQETPRPAPSSAETKNDTQPKTSAPAPETKPENTRERVSLSTDAS